MPKFSLNKALSDVQKVIGEEVVDLSQKDPQGLYEPIRFTLDLGGKRLRPLILWLTSKAFNPRAKLSEAAPLMKAVELFHNFSLIHDDLMDDAPIRRGKPTVFKEWGSNQAVLSGDAMLIEAYDCLGRTEQSMVYPALQIFNSMASAVCVGQQMDMEFEKTPLADLTLEDYMEMVSYKTGALITGSAILGALVGNLSKEDELELIQFAFGHFGGAFQVMDDYLDIFSDTEEFGKRNGGDILEEKRTFLLLDAYSKAPDRVEKAMTITDEDQKIAAVTDLYRELGSDQEALNYVSEVNHISLEMLQKVSADTSLLRELLSSLLNRRF